ncbi:MAG: YegS/Rv2252/BmrU family lipid kinase [Vulcanimicrobiaceae bacterium]
MIARLVINRRARRGREMAALVRAELAAAGIACVEDGGGPRPARYDLIVSAGGDGTFVSLIPDAIARGVPMGIVPLGTFNDLARTLDIPLDVGQACRIIAGGATRTIDVGRVNGRHFVNEASIGLSSRIARLQTPDVKQRFGFAGVAWTTLAALARARPMHLEIHFDGVVSRRRGAQLTVANSHRFGGVFDIDGAAIDDGLLDCYVFSSDDIFKAIGTVWAMQRMRRPVEGVGAFRAAQFHVVTKHAHRISADGEPAGKTPALFEVLPRALKVFASP